MRPHRLDGLTALVTGAGPRHRPRDSLRDSSKKAPASPSSMPTAKRPKTPPPSSAQRTRAFAGSISDEKRVERVIDDAVAWTGALDIVVNNAAIADPDNGPPDKLDLAKWRE